MMLQATGDLRWIDHPDHAELTVRLHAAVVPDGVCVVDRDGEDLWLLRVRSQQAHSNDNRKTTVLLK